MQLPSDNSTDFLKIPPHSIEAEQSVLGGLMFNNAAWIEVADILIENDFYRMEHQLIFSALKALSEANQPCDVVTLLEWLEKHARLERIGGRAYLEQLHKNTPSAANIVAYAKIVRERAILRQLIQVGTKIAESAFNARGREVNVLLDEAEKAIFNIAEQGARGQGGFIQLKDALAETMERIERLFSRESAITGLATGFIDFDEKTSGLQQSDLIIVAGRPSMGKTSFAMNVAEYAVIHGRVPVAVFSMEMSSEQLAMRLLASVARVDLQKVRTGRLNDDDWTKLVKALGILSDVPLFIDDSAALSPTEMGARTRRLAREQGHLGLIIIDYIQLMQVPNTRENRVTEVSEISRSLKALAKELNVPVMALSQLNRGLEQRPKDEKRPRMSDLRESGSLEQDADLIAFIYRDEVYNEDSINKGIAEVIIGKQRNGPIGTVYLTFLNHITKFENHEEDFTYKLPAPQESAVVLSNPLRQSASVEGNE